jgi:hypothetical protein
MKLETAINKLLTNKIVLYIVSTIAILNVLGYLFYGNINAVLYFVILAALVSYFSKNMIIVFLVPLILVNLWVGSQNQLHNVEGMENNDSEENTAKSTMTPQTQMQPQMQESSPSEPSEPSGNEPFKNKKGNHKLDYSGTLSDTYNHLNELLGSEGMKSLTNDTKQLMEQQKQLADSMQGLQPILNSFGPLIKQAEGLLGGLNGAGGVKGIEGLSDMMKKFGGLTQPAAPTV